ncbi:ABC transporter substrate-binding protein [Marinoscillum sp. MHG1-6]|uniref:ABC transporter substrate-binding protein n=1 Tax=Marinoscillum sp. MHG1-6 TaxID=2959627 RepID=UPI002157E0FF|nr:extracellular solute-binding protein [Marinoscillum sp. MHG1-6]
MAKVTLKGITWGHSRGITPLLAYAQRFNEKHPDVEVTWKKRTLQEFADFPIEKLVNDYDLLIIDHPWVGCADATRCVLPLDEYLSKEYLEDQAKNSVGFSHASYNYGGHQWALAIDAATPVASYRQDLFEANGASLPETWEDLLGLAAKGKVSAPAIPIDLLMNFYMFCVAQGVEPFQSKEEVIDAETGLKALEIMREFYGLLDKDMFTRNPIAIANLMSTSDDYWYCPFAYGYSNYSRVGYADKLLHYTGLVTFSGKRLRSTLGGTGLAVSASSANKEWAVKFAEEVVSGEIQATLYTENGGQPGHLKAWESETNNLLTHHFFKNTLETLQEAYVRPRYNKYLHFQDHAGHPIQEYLRDGGNSQEVLDKINKIYRDSLS